jgi:hypothetical protein
METNAGEYPFLIAAATNLPCLSVVYELVRANPGATINNAFLFLIDCSRCDYNFLIAPASLY